MNRLASLLKQYWGYEQFRPLQEAIITSILSGADTLALLPTGGGKSVCYQLPALAMDGLCLVVSPLVALMHDQVARLRSLHIDAVAIDAGMRAAAVRNTLEQACQGAYKLLYVSPERLQTRLFNEYLPGLDLSFIAVDEAHCISQWGHDFRPDYLKIGQLRRVFRNIPVLALTASATEAVQQDICLQLQLRQPALFRQSFERDNLYYEVRYSEHKTADTLEAVRGLQGSCIIYCRSRRQTESLARQLQQQGLPALAYHAGMKRELREAAQNRWMQSPKGLMVATTAFGMGIDKADVRLVLHYDAPEHLEAWYQEAGRAGRDGQPASALTLYNYSDLKRLEESTALQYPGEAYLRQVYQCVAEYLQVPIGNEPDQYFPFELADMSKKFGLKAVEASYALKLLEQEGLWTLTDSVLQPATLQFTADRHRLDHIVATYPALGYIITNLLRLYSHIFYYPAPFRPGALARQLKLRQEQVQASLLQLQQMGVLDYQQQHEGPRLYFHHLRVDSRHLLLNLERIGRLRQAHLQRSRAMTAFLENKDQCRDGMLLRYFNEQPQKNCGHCDVCRRQSLTARSPARLQAQLRQLLSRGPQLPAELLRSFAEGEKEIVINRLRQLLDEGYIVQDVQGRLALAPK